jgi:hypothetical protein
MMAFQNHIEINLLEDANLKDAHHNSPPSNPHVKHINPPRLPQLLSHTLHYC